MTSVLVPVDGSATAECALDLGVGLARQLDADLVLVRSSWGSTDAEVRAYLEALRARTGVDAGTWVTHRFAADALHDVALDHDDPVLVLACHGRSGWGHVLLGSLSEEILARAGAPAFVVGPRARRLQPWTDRSAPSRSRLGWCIDRATDPELLLPFCEDWAARLRLDVDVLTVEEEDERPVSRFHPASREQVRDVVGRLVGAGVQAHGQVLEELQPARRLSQFATDHDLALLVADKRSGTGLAREALGSTVMNLVHQSPCPVLVPPQRG